MDPSENNQEEEEEEEEAVPLQQLASPAVVLDNKPEQDLCMSLTPEEEEWATNVKLAIEGWPDLDELTDYMYAQLALVDKGNTSAAVERAYALQSFRQEYDIRDTCEDACHRITRWITRQPGHVLNLFYSPDHGYVLCFDMSNFDTHWADTPEGIKDFLAGTYYEHHALCRNLDVIRKGVTMFVECSGFHWKTPNMVDFNAFRTALEESVSCYPFNLRKILFFNTGVMVNTMVSMTRKFLPEQIRNKLEVGHQTESPLREVFLVPNVQVATERVVQSFTTALRLRYENVNNFRLEV